MSSRLDTLDLGLARQDVPRQRERGEQILGLAHVDHAHADVLDGQEFGGAVEPREEVLQKKRDLIARKGAIEAELRTTIERLDTVSTRFLTSATPAVAASELQKLVKDMAAQANTEVRSERILPPAERGELLEIPVEIAVSGEIRQLVDLLARLDSAPKLLTVQDVRVRVVNVSQPKDLLTTLTLSGYILPGKTRI